jgi:hypothetical protein
MKGTARITSITGRATLTALTLLLAFVATGPPAGASDSAEGVSRGSDATSSKWRLKYKEEFGAPIGGLDAPWIRDDYDPAKQVNWVDDNGARLRAIGGDAFAAQLSGFDTYLKEFKFGRGNWLTASLSARASKPGEGDSFNDLGKRPSITSEVLPGAGGVAKLDVPSHTGGALIRTTEPLPRYYRIEYELKAIDFGGKRDGTLSYDGRFNGYSTDGCKTLHPWEAFRDLPYCEWSDVRDGPGSYNGFHFLSIVDNADPTPRNRIFYHTNRKLLVDAFNNARPDINAYKYEVCNPSTGKFYPYSESNFNTINPLFMGPQNANRSDYGGNRQMFRTPCGRRPAGVAVVSAVEMKPELMPRQHYTFAAERTAAGYTIEISGNFKYVGKQTYRFHRNFIEDEDDNPNIPIWHYNVTSDEYDGRFNDFKEICRDGRCARWDDTWPGGSSYPDYFVLGDVYTNVYEGDAAVDNISLYVPKD